MKKWIAAILMMAISVLALSACGNSSTAEKNSKDEINVIYTSFYPIYDLTSKIAVNHFKVESFMPLDQEPHEWEPSAKDMEKLSKAKLLVVNGAGMEPWLKQVQENLPDLPILDLSQHVDLIKTADGEINPHTWLSPKNGEIYVKAIAAELAKTDSAHKADYEKNAGKLTKSLADLIEEYSGRFQLASDNKDFVTIHPAYSYLARDFGLHEYALQGLTSLETPSLKRSKEAVEYCQAHRIQTIFYEEGEDRQTAESLAKEIKGQAVPLMSMEYVKSLEDLKDQNYVTILKEDLEKIAKGMGH